MHSYVSEFSHSPCDFKPCHSTKQCVTKKLSGSLKVTTFKSAFLCSFLPMDVMYQLGKTTESATLFIYVAIVFVL